MPDPERVVAEARRVLRSGGVAVWVTPNRLTFGRPDEIVDPYHWIEFDAAELAALVTPAFSSVRALGLMGSPRHAQFDRAEKQRMEAVLRLDVLGVRHRGSVQTRQRLYDAALRATRRRGSALGDAIMPQDFHLSTADLNTSLDLVAVCER